MKQIKREYLGGETNIVVWREEDSYTFAFSKSQDGTARTFLDIQSTPGSEVVGTFYGINTQGTKAVEDRLFDNLLRGRTEPITLSDLEEVLCEPIH